MRFHVDQTAGTRNRRVIRRVLIQPNPHKAPQPQRIRQLPGNPAFAVDALKVAQQQRPEVDPRGQRRPTILSRIELRTPSLHKLIELLRLQQFIEPLIERMSWRRRQLRMSNPNVFLLFSLLARPHRHRRILRILPVDPSNSFAYASGLTPRAASYRRGKSLSALAAERFRVARRCSRWASCPFAICETVLCDGSGFLAYGRRRLQPPVQVAGVPTISPCLRSTDRKSVV